MGVDPSLFARRICLTLTFEPWSMARSYISLVLSGVALEATTERTMSRAAGIGLLVKTLTFIIGRPGSLQSEVEWSLCAANSDERELAPIVPTRAYTCVRRWRLDSTERQLLLLSIHHHILRVLRLPCLPDAHVQPPMPPLRQYLAHPRHHHNSRNNTYSHLTRYITTTSLYSNVAIPL